MMYVLSEGPVSSPVGHFCASRGDCVVSPYRVMRVEVPYDGDSACCADML